MKKYKILIIGFGSIGKRHFNNLFSIGQDNIAVFDPVPKSFEFDSPHKYAKYTDLEKAFKWNPEVVLVCSPTKLHSEHIIKSLNKGCHIFV